MKKELNAINKLNAKWDIVHIYQTWVSDIRPTVIID
jgi:hypothetical protein